MTSGNSKTTLQAQNRVLKVLEAPTQNCTYSVRKSCFYSGPELPRFQKREHFNWAVFLISGRISFARLNYKTQFLSKQANLPLKSFFEPFLGWIGSVFPLQTYKRTDFGILVSEWILQSFAVFLARCSPEYDLFNRWKRESQTAFRRWAEPNKGSRANLRHQSSALVVFCWDWHGMSCQPSRVSKRVVETDFSRSVQAWGGGKEGLERVWGGVGEGLGRGWGRVG